MKIGLTKEDVETAIRLYIKDKFNENQQINVKVEDELDSYAVWYKFEIDVSEVLQDKTDVGKPMRPMYPKGFVTMYEDTK